MVEDEGEDRNWERAWSNFFFAMYVLDGNGC